MDNRDLQKLAIRIKRLTTDEQKQAQLIEDIKGIQPEQISLLEGLIVEHDSEYVQLLNQKIEEQDEAVRQTAEKMGVSGAQSFTPEPQEFQKFMKEIFSNKESFALFLTFASDQVIAVLADVLEKISPEEKKQRFKSFFVEMRAHKAHVETLMKNAGKKELIHQLEKREKQLSELDAVLENVKNNTTYIV